MTEDQEHKIAWDVFKKIWQEKEEYKDGDGDVNEVILLNKILDASANTIWDELKKYGNLLT